ncbi:hypothetical protein [Burkholderia ubonensis]|uniref:hypothetical protein n=1 Tax=Burkholderia ubonensis TaxID=101571 RepID=UPI000A5CB6B8|nr:hypothetical protein [Burkholderia ubonensis]
MHHAVDCRKRGHRVLKDAFPFREYEVGRDDDALALVALGEQARLDIVAWIEAYYNRQRMRTSIGYCTPVECESLRAAA